MPLCAQDSSFGPGSTCRQLDFTLYFEQSILSFGPDIVFLLFAFVRLLSLVQEKNQLASPGWSLLTAKVLALLLLLTSNGASLPFLLQARRSDVLYLWVPAPSLQLVSVIPLGGLVLLEHFRSRAPSMLVICYSLLKGLFCATMLRSYLKIGLLRIAHSTFVASTLVVASYFLVLCVELIEKRTWLRHKVSTSSFISRSLYFWLMPLLWSARRKVLTLDDCGSIPEGLDAYNTRQRLLNALGTTPKTSHYLFRASFKAFTVPVLAPILPRAGLLLATFAQPLLVNRTISFVSSDDPSDPGWALVGAFVCVYAMLVLTTSLYWEKVFDATVGFRGALVGVIYDKSLRLSSAKGRSLGGGVASTYMSVDVECICQGLESFHEIWANLGSIVLSVVILYSQASWTAFLPIGVAVLLSVVAGVVGSRVGPQQAAWLAATDRRVKFISSMINNFLSIKWSRYEAPLAAHAAELRLTETREMRRFYNFITFTAAISNAAETICILVVLGPYSVLATHYGKAPLDVVRLYTIVTSINLLGNPLNMLGQYLPTLAAAYASVQRIQGFLLLDEQPSLTSGDEKSEIQPFGNEKYVEMKVRPVGHPQIKMTGASFAWTPDADTFLEDVTLDLSEPDLYMCVGPVASGKTLLLLSIMNETSCKGGQYAPPDCRIAYSAQDALIVPGTVRENILFGRPYDTEWYGRVIDACGLVPDLKQFRSGDGTLLGERGRRLSGGQKQRVALARAVYADAPWTLLDDPLSALDAETEAHVFRSLFGPAGLLKGKGVLLVTHSIKHLSVAHRIVVLNAGKVQYSGTLEQIQQQGYNPSVQLDKGKETMTSAGQQITKQEEEETTYIEEEEENEAAIAKTSTGLAPYLFFARMAQRWNTVICLSLAVFYGLVSLGLQIYLEQWSASDQTNYLAWVGGYAGYTAGVMLVLGLAIYVFCGVVSTVSSRAIHAAELKSLINTSPSYFMSTPAGRIINRFSQDIMVIDFEWPLSFFNGLSIFVTLTGTVIFIFVPTPWLALSIIPLGTMYYGVMKIYLGTSKQLQHLEAVSKSPLYTTFSTTMSGIETIRALRVEGYFREQNDLHLDRSQKPFYFRFSGMRFLRTMLSFISFVFAVGLAALAIGFRHSTNASLLGLALSNLTNLTLQLSYLLMSLALIENGSVSISRVHEIVSLPPEEKSGEVQGMTDSDTDCIEADWPKAGRVVFENVELKYRADLDPVLRGISFTIPSGTKVGICGRSGSGKSTTILALFRALDQSLMSGKIEIDGVDISTVPLSTLRHSLSLVAQEPFIWHDTLRSNLDPEKIYTEADIWAALKSIGISDAVSSLSEGLDTVLDDNSTFSKGQRQLLCLARVLLRKRKIVVLDEASSSLDHQTDEQMRAVIRSELNDCTVIAVAHRIATIVDFDMILVMEDGVIVETGTPDELLSQHDSRFARLAASQGIVL